MRLPRGHEYRQSQKKMRGLADIANLPQEAALVISKGYATLYELQTIYSWNDLLDLAELAIVSGYNEWCAYNSE